MGPKPQDPRARFARHIARRATGCIEWTGGLAGGYGQFNDGTRTRRAHRVAWEFVHGPIADADTCVCHRCDNRKCVNVDHLFLGSRKDNNDDMAAKGRGKGGVEGARNPRAVLCEGDVLAMRAARQRGLSYGVIAAEYGVGKQCARAVCVRETWKHVP